MSYFLNFRAFKIVLNLSLLLGSILFFQSCAQNKHFVRDSQNPTESETYPSESPKDATDDSTLPIDSSQAPATSQAPACQDINAVSVYPWVNAGEDAMTKAPVPGVNKIGTFSIKVADEENANAAKPLRDYSNDVGWNVYFIREISATGSSNMVTFINKFDPYDMANGLTCFFGPTLDTSAPGCTSITDPAAWLSYQNVGVGLNGVDGFSGFLSCPPKYVACKVTQLNKSVKFIGADGTTKTILANQPFILKRGCGKPQ